MEKTLQFFSNIFKHTPNPKSQYVSWGSVSQPLFLSVQELLDGVGTVTIDRDLFYSPAPRTQGGMKKTDTFGSSVAWVEYDHYKLDSYIDALIPPSYVVSSGKGHHLYWILDGFYSPSDVERVNRVLANHVRMIGEFCGNINRVLRVPGSFNHKPEYDKPLSANILQEHPERVYSIGDLMKLQPYDSTLLAVPEGLSRSERDFRLALTMFKWGVSSDAVRETLFTYSDKVQELATEDGGSVHYVERTLVKAMESAGISDAKAAAEAQELKALANVEFTPLGFLVSPDGTELGLSLRLSWGDQSIVTAANASDFSSRSKVIAWLHQHTGTRTFFGSDGKALALWGLLVDTTPDRYQLQVEHAGRYDLKNGTKIFIYEPRAAIAFPEEAPLDIYWQAALKVGGGLDLGDDAQQVSTPEMSAMLNLMLNSQPPDVILPALGWMAATPFKPVFESLGARVPTLLLYGVRGSGKTSLARSVLLPFIGSYQLPVAADITLFALIGHLGLTNAWPVWIGEYRASNRNAAEFQQALRSAYDGGTMDRGRPNQSIVSYSLTAPIVVDGETPFGDAANSERAISVRLQSEHIRPGSQYVDSFTRLQTWDRAQRSAMAKLYLLWTLTKGRDYIGGLYTDGMMLFGDRFQSSRITNNFAVAWAGLQALHGFATTYGLDVSIPDDPEPFVVTANNTHTPGLGTVTYLDGLLAQISHMWAMPNLETDYDSATDILWFNLTKAIYALRVQTDVQMLTLQLQERLGVYVVGPERRTGGAVYWGIDIKKAQALGLDVNRPVTTRFATTNFGSNIIGLEKRK